MSYIIDAVYKAVMSFNKIVSEFRVAGDTAARYQFDANGKHEWGSGSAAVDTNMYRSAADTLATDDIFNPALGVKDTVTTYTTTGAVVTYGVVQLNATGATTYSLPDPTIGRGVRIVSTSTQAQTVVMSTTNGVKFNTTGVSIAFAGQDASISLVGLSATRWAVIGTYSTGVALA